MINLKHLNFPNAKINNKKALKNHNFINLNLKGHQLKEHHH